jgi:hypothetical protein
MYGRVAGAMWFSSIRNFRALSVPARRPIKPVYVRRFVALIEDIEAIATAESMLRGEDEEP